MHSHSDDQVKVLSLVAIAAGCLIAAAYFGVKLRGRVAVDDILTVHLRGPDGQAGGDLAVTVLGVKPNGQIVIATRKRIQCHKEVWTVALSGQVRIEDIQPDRCVDSRDIIDLKYRKTEPDYAQETDEEEGPP